MKNRPDFHPAPTKIVQLMGLEPANFKPYKHSKYNDSGLHGQNPGQIILSCPFLY